MGCQITHTGYNPSGVKKKWKNDVVEVGVTGSISGTDLDIVNVKIACVGTASPKHANTN